MKDRNRQQTVVVTFRVTPEVKKMLEFDAEKSMLSLSGLIKYRVCGDAAYSMPTRQARIPADLEALRKLLGATNKVGSNINQIAKRMNSTDNYQIEKVRLKAIKYTLIEIKNSLVQALGVKTR